MLLHRLTDEDESVKKSTRGEEKTKRMQPKRIRDNQKSKRERERERFEF